ncbi:hypothetical protein [Sodalis-like endosymbiont of Proechinophthirus fluctus]|uniref:hypothetical protein n=1 Tax=Sodalis-like endosymbiont of Proechinophthirus fluctus TaxID=1462730 RepID=UPI00082BED17|nr:hypothetical protein [Sodalis-like endosymbiont of Proechinophthirus fluctus]
MAITAQAENVQSGLRQLSLKAHPISWWMLVIKHARDFNEFNRVISPTLLTTIMKEFNLTEVQVD